MSNLKLFVLEGKENDEVIVIGDIVVLAENETEAISFARETDQNLNWTLAYTQEIDKKGTVAIYMD